MKKSTLIIILAIITLLIYRIIPYNSVLVEQFYSNYLYKVVRLSFDYTFGILPFPTVYLLFVILLLLGIKYFLKFKYELRYGNKYQCLIKKLVSDVIVFVSLIIISFYWLWAFNYKRPSFQIKNNLSPQILEEEWLFAELQFAHEQLLENWSKDNGEFSDVEFTESTCRSLLDNMLPRLGYETVGRVRVRSLKPKGTLLVWSTAGVYIPFVSEGHIDDGLHYITKPFTLTHEMLHGYGITEESTCNFVAFLVCINSQNQKIRYSGWMGYFRYLLSACRRTNKEEFESFRNNIDSIIYHDIEDIYRELNKYPDILPILRDKIYNHFLKSHGIKDGTISYSRIIHLAAAWQEKHESYYLSD